LLPIVDGKVVFTECFINKDIFLAIKLYNDEVNKFIESINNGESFYMTFDTIVFYDGMRMNRIKDFFAAMERASVNYESFVRCLAQQ
jgi:hypothetical protein